MHFVDKIKSEIDRFSYSISTDKQKKDETITDQVTTVLNLSTLSSNSLASKMDIDKRIELVSRFVPDLKKNIDKYVGVELDSEKIKTLKKIALSELSVNWVNEQKPAYERYSKLKNKK